MKTTNVPPFSGTKTLSKAEKLEYLRQAFRVGRQAKAILRYRETSEPLRPTRSSTSFRTNGAAAAASQPPLRAKIHTSAPPASAQSRCAKPAGRSVAESRRERIRLNAGAAFCATAAKSPLATGSAGW